LSISSLGLFVASGIYWFPIWRRERSGTAHALFLTNVALAAVVVFKTIQLVSVLLETGECDYPVSLVAGFLVNGAAVSQFALTRGYFNWKE
jgi:hypothetical protein